MLQVLSCVCGGFSVAVRRQLKPISAETLAFTFSNYDFDPVSDSTPTAVVTEIDEDSAFTEAQDLRVLLSQGKRSVEMNASSSVGEELDPRCAGTDVTGMRMEDDTATLMTHGHRSQTVKDTWKCCEGLARPIEA